MFIAINIGNTNTKIGLVKDQEIFILQERTETLKTVQDFERALFALISKHEVESCKLDGSILASVVPERTEPCINALTTFVGKKPIVIDKHIKTSVDFSNYGGLLGSDRIAVCVSAWNRCKAPFVVIDMGTATTFNVVDRNGVFLGGAILPGLQMCLESINRKTAQIPKIDFGKQTKVIGHNTEECVLSGAYYGTAAMLDGLVKDIEESIGESVNAILTGGSADVVRPYIKTKVIYEPDLLMHGLADIYLAIRRDF